MSFNPDHAKQAQEVIFCRKTNKITYPPLYFNNAAVKPTHLQVYRKLFFYEHVNNKIVKETKGITLVCNWQAILARRRLMIIYESFISTQFDYGDVTYDQPSKVSISNKTESLQYNAALAITGAITSSFREKLYQGINQESPIKRMGEEIVFAL